MNELTRAIVTKVAKENKAMAKKNDISFDFAVRNEHWNQMISRFGWKMKVRALELWFQFHPEMYQQYGNELFLDDGHKRGFEIDVELSNIVERVLKRKIGRQKELQLEDWGNLPKEIADPQMRLF
jgi:hypothetical protein